MFMRHAQKPLKTCFPLCLNLFMVLGMGVFFMNGCDQSSSTQHLYRIGISQIIEHKALDETRRGIEDTLNQELGKDNVHILYKNAQGSLPISKQIAQYLVEASPQVVVGVSTASAQALKASLRGSNIPLVFTCVTDPVKAGLIPDLKTPPPGVTGVVDTPPLNAQLLLIQKLLPSLKTLGILYTPGEINSVTVLENLRNLCQQHGIALMEQPVLKSSEISASARALMPQVQAVYVPQDNAIVAAMSSLIRVSYELKIPVFASDPGSVTQGALAAVCYSYYDIGMETGRKILEILKGKKPESLKIEPPQAFKYYINDQSAEKLGLKIPEKDSIPWEPQKLYTQSK